MGRLTFELISTLATRDPMNVMLLLTAILALSITVGLAVVVTVTRDRRPLMVTLYVHLVLALVTMNVYLVAISFVAKLVVDGLPRRQRIPRLNMLPLGRLLARWHSQRSLYCINKMYNRRNQKVVILISRWDKMKCKREICNRKRHSDVKSPTLNDSLTTKQK